MPLELIRTDIVRMHTDAIVNAANSALAPGGGVCGAIFSAAGYDRLEKACRAIGHCEVGQAVITPGYDLPAKYVIHAVGPIWRGGNQNEEALLRSAYRSALRVAVENGCRSVAFPLISSGIYGYPKEEAFRVAVSAIQDFLLTHEISVSLILFDRGNFALGEKLFASIQSYIDDHYVAQHSVRDRRTDLLQQRRQMEEQEARPFGAAKSAPSAPAKASEPREGAAAFDRFGEPAVFDQAAEEEEARFDTAALPDLSQAAPGAPAPGQKKRSLKELLFHLEDSFSDALLRLIDEKGMTDVEVYKRANLDRKLFSKLRKSGYKPSKQTAVALAIALRLNLDETADLLGRAGYALSPSSRGDVIVRYFIEEGIYDIYAVNEALFTFGEKLLGA
jgi:O-acetyl-ADP-ribose deacetylase (regulator of RNase III)